MTAKSIKSYIIIVLVALMAIAASLYYLNSKKSAPSIEVLSPKTGDVIKSGSVQTIRWVSKGIPSENKISVSIKRVPPPPLQTEGQEFDPIVFIELANTGSKEWVVSDMYPNGEYILEVASYASIPVTDPIVAESGKFIIQKEKRNRVQAAFKSDKLGLEFSYPSGPEGYVLEERMPIEGEKDLIQTIILLRTEDKLNESNIPVGGEGPATITISVFKNSKQLPPEAWAEENIMYSNTNLRRGEISRTTISGAKAIRYFTDGLYASENAVIADNDRAYVITGMFLDEDSDLRRDFEPLIRSFKIIPRS
ncbi:MAG: hypothetical protein WCT49_03105 [Candidatus Paceibacterota bacterium]|jgi:hypothetical protein|nr:hypothetical protein [Candidatus Paceibacterota bacterium]